MLREVSVRYCDRCGREIVGYACGKEFLTVDELGEYYVEATDFCGACALSYNRWMELGKNKETVLKERQIAREHIVNTEEAYDKLSVEKKKQRDYYLSENFEV